MKKVPQRMCVSCKSRRDKKDLMRVVLLPDGNIDIDLTGRKPGRGAYICRSEKCLEEACKLHRLDRGLHTQVPKEVLDCLREEMGAGEHQK